MTDEERLHPTWKTRLIEWGKIASACTIIFGAIIGAIQWANGSIGDVWRDVQGMIETTTELQREQVDMQRAQQNVLGQLANVVEKQTDLLGRVEKLEARRARDASPAIRFTNSGSAISDGRPGEIVRLTWSFIKLRDCGRPSIDLLFRNGGDQIHRFRDVSVLDEDGRGVAFDPDPTQAQSISYTARIPAGEGVEPGAGFGYVRVSYPEKCPAVESVQSPRIYFQILPERSQQ
ncbi:hypothetical protein SAMN05444007_108260 [Cribrihabitans marinus]|uniref:Uncharacterized protein n=1 Tax=Cribrihabitans marinus TaxID=1227549 RepID=A0A1H7CQE6_9RHOB|nr:hypothetical protein [Cribrihabitans marinus]GGH36406.1 hypothetical protein GCM10010973_30310 [Cribrihabitans marinus]SEJ91849.1 hypothetical protein SAMN05444007_108260 [Cribrihabitans marinus]